MEVLNKIDLLEPEVRDGLLARSFRDDSLIAVSAKSGQGLDQLLARFETQLVSANIHFHLALDATDGAGLAWVYRHGQVLERRFSESGTVELDLSATPAELEKFEHRFGSKLSIHQQLQAEI